MRRALTTVAATSAAMVYMVPTAFAGMDFIVYGSLGPDGAYGPRHSLNYVSAKATQSICVNALNADGSGFANSVSECAAPGLVAARAYCACKLRFGYVFPRDRQSILVGDGNFAEGRQFW